jgi:pentatricopeptide repeat protein
MSVLKPGQTSVDDLEMIAGRREGIRRVRQFGATQRVRRNSTSAVERSSRPLGEAYESVEQDSGKQSLKPITKAELSLAEAELRDKLEAQDRTAYIEIKRAIENRDRKTALRLVDEYRNPLALHSDPAISTADNVNPPYFTQAGYNIAIIALHRFRDPGEPITEILKTYNEMLERDVLPNIKTYSLVIRSLMERHDEVQSATRNAWGRRRWIEWDRARARSFKKEGLGISNYQYADRHQALLPIETQIEALKKENNYENALRLFHSGVLYNRHRTFQPQVYAHLMSAAAKKGDLQTVLQVWGHLEGANKRTQQTNDASFDTRPLAILYSYLIEAYAKAPEGGVDGMQDILKKFLTDEKNGHIRDGRSSDGSLEYPLIDDTGMPVLDAEGNPRMTVMSDGVDIMRAVVKFFDSLLYGYAYLGETEKVDALLDLMRKTTREEEKRAGHLAQVNSSAVMNICRGYWDRKDYNRALEVLEKIKTEKGASHIRRAATEMVLDAIAESNVDVVASLAKLTERDQPFFEFTCLRRAITLLVFEFDRADLPTERTKDLIQTIELLASSWPKNTKWNVDAHTLSAICEQATKVDMLQDAYAVLQKSIACGNVLPSHGGIKAYDVLSPIFEAKQTLEGKIEVIALARRCQVDLRQGQVLPVISKLAEALSNNSTTVKTLVDQIGQSGLQAFLQVLCKLGDKSGRPLLGDEAAAFDENLVKIVKSLGSLRVSNDLLEDDQRLIVLLLDERLGTTAARPIAEEAFGTELVASLDVHVESPGQTSSVLSDAPTRMFETASEASTRPTELSEGTEAPRKWEVPFNLTKEVDGHHGRNPTLTPIQAYSILKRNEAEGRLPSPAAIGRLAVALSRLGFADKVAELYKLAHQAVPCLREDRQLGAWYEIENNMISACCLLGQLEQAGFHRAAILEQGQVPSADAYATMIASAKDTTDDASVARELWEESQRLGVQPNLYLYNTIISKLSRARKAEMALEFFKRMKSEQIKPSSVTYGAVINACCRVGDDQSATTLFEEMQAQPNHKPRVPPYKSVMPFLSFSVDLKLIFRLLCSTMMQLHLQTHPSRELVLHYYNQMVQAEVAPSAHTYKLLLDAYGNLPPVDLPAMQQVFENLCNDSRVAVAGTHWASMIHAAGISAGDAKKACEIFDSIATHRSSQYLKTIEPVCWEALMHVLAEHKMIDEMDAYRGKMTEQDAKPTAYVNNMLIKGYANVGLIEKSRAIFESMSDSGTGQCLRICFQRSSSDSLLTVYLQVWPPLTTIQSS